MMEQSRRARRMGRHHKLRKQSPLNLVSLMDIFTILVFFLLVSSSNTQQLPSNKDLKLPTSVATKVPRETLVIAITADQILVQGRKVADVEAAINTAEPLINGLQEELEFHTQKVRLTAEQDQQAGFPVTIMGDENIPYELLRKILATCRQANYTQIAFAATQKAKEKS